MQLNNEKEVARFIKVLNDVNQLMKTVKNSSDYTLVKGKFICYPNSDSGDLGILRLEAFDNGKKDNVTDYINSLSGCVNGMELYAFISANKKNINEIEINKTNFVIKTSTGETFKSEDITPTDFNYKHFGQFIKKPEFKNKTLLEEKVLSNDEKAEFSAISFPSLTVGDYELRITPKAFLKIHDSIDLIVRVYDYNEELNMIEVESNNPKLFTSKQYFLYIKR